MREFGLVADNFGELVASINQLLEAEKIEGVPCYDDLAVSYPHHGHTPEINGLERSGPQELAAMRSCHMTLDGNEFTLCNRSDDVDVNVWESLTKFRIERFVGIRTAQRWTIRTRKAVRQAICCEDPVQRVFNALVQHSTTH